jgi:long-chain acyl-CoA synthetase
VVCEGRVAGTRSLESVGEGLPTGAPTHREPSDPAAILYTSGTTGRQKGATLSVGNVVFNAHTTRHYLRMDPDDRLLLFLPLFHVFGQNFILNGALAAGSSVVLHRRFDPQTVLDSIERDQVTMFFGVPTVYVGLLNAGVEPARLATVRYFFSAAATMPLDVAQRWGEVYGRVIYEGYGLTETSPFASYNHEWAYRPGSVGTALANVELRIVDPEDREVPRGTWGEICIKGPNVMLGYWNRPEDSAEALRGGWFHSGDVGYMDDDGYVFIVDRTKDMINTAGFKIWPREVEEVLYEHPSVAECAVVGVPDPAMGEVAVAVVVPRQGQSAAADVLDVYCRERLATYKMPRQFMLLEALPKSPTGKILKRILREQLAASPEPRRSDPR